MRQIILDTETTGLDPALGHRIIEIAGVEIVNRRLTGNHFHRYVNPDRDSEDAALQIHGLSREFLSDKPKFAEIAGELMQFLQDAELVIHNAAFDIAFLDHELRLLDRQPVSTLCPCIVDTLAMARDLHPGKRAGLDALCERYEIDHSARTLHGALLDAQLLAEVYLSMTRGQESLIIEEDHSFQMTLSPVHVPRPGFSLKIVSASAEELTAHNAQLAELEKASGGACVWMKLERLPQSLDIVA